MLLPGLALLIGAAVGHAAGGRLRALAGLRFHHTPLLVVAVTAQLTLGWAPAPVRPVMVLISYVLVGVWLASNYRGRPRPLVVALSLLAAGWATNLAVMAPNSGMPVSLHAAAAVGAPASTDVTQGNLFKHVPADRDTALRPLGDVIPLPPFRTVISVGDILLFAGIATAVALGMTGRAVATT